jgi:hypothetical protein
MAKKFGIFRNLFPVSDLAFMRDAALDPGDGLGSYSERDKMLLVQLRAATRENVNGDKEKREQRKATIWLVKYLLRESQVRMTMLDEPQSIIVREKTDFHSPAVALEILGIGWREQLTAEECRGDPFSGQYFPEDFGLSLSVEEQRLWYLPPIVAHLSPRFLEAALARKGCPKHARHQIQEWQDHGGFQHFRYRIQELPKGLREDALPRRTREDCQYKPNHSGNRKGRPKGSRNKSKSVRRPFFDEMVTATIEGKKCRLPRRIAFLRTVKARAIAAGDGEIIRLFLDRDLDLSKVQAKVPYRDLTTTVLSLGGIRPNSLEGAIHALGGGELLYANSSTARMLLEPWVVEWGLAHLGERRLPRQDQRIVLFFARHPKRTQWPTWWEPDLREREKTV